MRHGMEVYKKWERNQSQKWILNVQRVAGMDKAYNYYCGFVDVMGELGT